MRLTKLIALLLLALVPASAFATLGTANGAAAGTAGGGSTATTASRTTAASGSGFVIFVQWDRANTLSSVGDSKSNAYTIIGTEIDDASGGYKTRLYSCDSSCTGGSNHTFTATMSAGGSIVVLAFEITTTNGAGITRAQTAQQNDTSSPFTSGGITTTTATTILVGAVGANSASNPASNTPGGSFSIVTNAEFTNGATDWTCGIATRSVSSTGTYDYSWTQTGGSRAGAYLIAFSETAGGGGGGTQPPRSMHQFRQRN